MAASIIGVGQPLAGDDGVGIAVARRVRELLRGDGEGLNVIEVAEVSEIVPLLLNGSSPVVIVDAMVGEGATGEVVELETNSELPATSKLMSTHGIGVADALALARTLADDSALSRVRILAVRIERPGQFSERLSGEVAGAVEVAAQRALQLAKG